MGDTYKLIFRGDIAPGHAMMTVRASLKEQFRLDDQGINKLFCGRPVVLKKNLDEQTAGKWCDLLGNLGAVVEAIAEIPSGEAPEPDGAAAQDTSGESSYNFDVLPAGSDVLKPGERAQATAVEVQTDHLSIAEPGSDVLKPEERKVFEPLEMDLSHLQVKP